MQKQMDTRFDKVDQSLGTLQNMLENSQQAFGKLYEQFGRNVVIKLMESEGIKDLTLQAQKLKDPDQCVSEGISEMEIDGLYLVPPIIVEITSVLRSKEKIETFLKKKKFIEKKYDCSFRGFFIVASSQFNL